MIEMKDAKSLPFPHFVHSFKEFSASEFTAASISGNPNVMVGVKDAFTDNILFANSYDRFPDTAVTDDGGADVCKTLKTTGTLDGQLVSAKCMETDPNPDTYGLCQQTDCYTEGYFRCQFPFRYQVRKPVRVRTKMKFCYISSLIIHARAACTTPASRWAA